MGQNTSPIGPGVSMDIPGFRIERELASGAAGPVYLAWQQAAERQVALKVIAGDHAAGVCGERIGAATELRHPHIAEVYDKRTCSSGVVLVLEYVSGGGLKQRLQSGIRLGELVRIMRLLGGALDHAHGLGIVHLDIRPENILFRLDGNPVLADFTHGWPVAENQPPAGVVAAAGKPGFMSPEQAGGQAVDHRSDLFSLGAVLYSVLTGVAPPQADAGAGAGHLSERIARLPTHLGALQPVIDQALAKNPMQRFQRGADLAAALSSASSKLALVNTTFKSVAVSIDEIQAVTGALFTAPADVARHGQRSRGRRKTVRRSLTLALLAAVVALGAGYVVNNQPRWLSTALAQAGLAENPLLRTAWLDAQSLHQDPNQSLSAIVAGYRRVLAMDSEHVQAQAAMVGLAEQWRASAMESLAQNDIAQADTKLAEMSAAFPDDVALDDLDRQLANRKTADALLTSTQALLRSHGLSDVPSATAAIQAYHEIMRLAPGHPVAQQELDVLAEHYAGLARTAAMQGDVQNAISYLERATAADSALPLLADVRGEIQQATAAQAAIDELLQQARAYRVQGLLVTPPGENAAELYNRVLATAPDNALARQGLSEVTSQLLSQANRMLDTDDILGVGDLVDDASAAGIEPEALFELETRVEDRTAALAAVAGNLREAESLLGQGFVTEPPERNAVALLREVERLDPGNDRAEALLAQSAERLVEVAMEAHAADLEEEAKQYLDLALTVTPDVPPWRALRESWE